MRLSIIRPLRPVIAALTIAALSVSTLIAPFAVTPASADGNIRVATGGASQGGITVAGGGSRTGGITVANGGSYLGPPPGGSHLGPPPQMPGSGAGQPPAKTTPVAGNGGSNGGGLVLKPDLLPLQGGLDWHGSDRIEIRNQGGLSAGAFRVAVLAGAESYSFNVAGLAAGTSTYESLRGKVSCGAIVVVLVDADHKIDELLENNNSTSFVAKCGYPHGPHYGPPPAP